MRKFVKSRRLSNDLLLGLVLVAVAGTGFWAGAGLRLGSATRMGPGYVPMLLSWLMLILGIGHVAIGLFRPGPRPEKLDARPFFYILAAIAFFLFSAERLGLIAAVAGVVFIAAVGDRRARWRPLAIWAVFLALAATGLFIQLLGVPLPVWPKGWGG
jgi:hypothetical protein